MIGGGRGATAVVQVVSLRVVVAVVVVVVARIYPTLTTTHFPHNRWELLLMG